MQLTVVAMLAASVGLTFWHNGIVNVAAQSVIGVGTIGLCVVYTKFLHDALPSKVRAGASSAVSSLTRVIMIPLSLLFGFISREADVFRATWLFAALFVVALVLVWKLYAGKHELTPVTMMDEELTQEYRK
jgi:MFS family permease